MKIIKRIILIMIMILVLSSCGHKKEKEITYTMSEEVVIEDITNYDEEIWIPSHQYLQLKFENKISHYTYAIYVQRWYEDAKSMKDEYGVDYKETRYETNILNNHNATVSNYIGNWYPNKLLFLDNDKEYYFDIYNESSKAIKYHIRLMKILPGTDMYVSEGKVISSYVDIDDVSTYNVCADCTSNQCSIKILGDAGLSFKIKEYDNLLVDSNTTIYKKYLSFGLYEYDIIFDKNDINSHQKFIVNIYNNNSTGKRVEYQIYADVTEIKNGSQIVDSGYYVFYTDINDDNKYEFVCDNNGIRLEVISVTNVDLFGGKKRYLVCINNTTPERLAGKITISCA